MLKIMTERQLEREFERRAKEYDWKKRTDERLWKMQEEIDRLMWRVDCLEGGRRNEAVCETACVPVNKEAK